MAKVSVHLPACAAGFALNIGVCVEGGKKLLRAEGPYGHHKGLVAVVSASKVSVAKNPGPCELGELLAVAKNAKFGLARQNLLAAQKRAFSAQDSESVVAK